MHPYCLYLHFLQLSESLQTSQINDWHPLKDVHTLVRLVHISVYIPWCVLLCFHVDSENQVGASVPPPRMLGQHYLKGSCPPPHWPPSPQTPQLEVPWGHCLPAPPPLPPALFHPGLHLKTPWVGSAAPRQPPWSSRLLEHAREAPVPLLVCERQCPSHC